MGMQGGLKASHGIQAEQASSDVATTTRRWLSPVAIAVGALVSPSLFSQEKKPSANSPETGPQDSLVDPSETRSARQQERSWLKMFGARLPSDDVGRDSLALNIEEATVRIEQALSKLPLGSLVGLSPAGELILSERFEVVARHTKLDRGQLLSLLRAIKEADLSMQELKARSGELRRTIENLNPHGQRLDVLVPQRTELEEEISCRAKEIGKLTDSLSSLTQYRDALQSGMPVARELKRIVGGLSLKDAQESIAGLEKGVAGAEQAQTNARKKLSYLLTEIAQESERDSQIRAIHRDKLLALQRKLAVNEEARVAFERKFSSLVQQDISSIIPSSNIIALQKDLAQREIQLARVEHTGTNRLGNIAFRAVSDRVGLDGPLAVEVGVNDPDLTLSLRGEAERLEIVAAGVGALTRQAIISKDTLGNLLEGKDDLVFGMSVREERIALCGEACPEWVSFRAHPRSSIDLTELGPTEVRVEVEGSGRILIRGVSSRNKADFNLRIASTGGTNAPTTISLPFREVVDEQAVKISPTLIVLNAQARVTALLNSEMNIDLEVRRSEGIRRLAFVRDGVTLLSEEEVRDALNKK